jgi:hypothetical protein
MSRYKGHPIYGVAVPAPENRWYSRDWEAQIVVLASKVEELTAKHAYFETVAARLEALELRQNPSMQVKADDPWMLMAR